MKLNSISASLISVFVNFLLGVSKLAVGCLVKSTALIADGIHSSLDVISSFVTFLGTKLAKKPADKEHPYGHARAQTIAGFVVTILLLISAIWIVFEGTQSIIQKEESKMSFWALVVILISIIANGVITKFKFKVGQKENNLALIADGEHSKADALSSIGVLIGVGLSFYFAIADGITAILVGFYIFYETYKLGREVTDNLLDVSSPEIEKKIKEICEKEEVNLLDIKTRKIGPENFAELKVGLNKEWKMERVSEVIKNLENLLLKEIENLKFVVIQVVSHDFRQGYIKSMMGEIQRFKDFPKKIILKKLGFRTIISIKDGRLYSAFGAPEYLVIDIDKEKNILQKKIIKNPYSVIGRGHGVRFAKLIEADKVITSEIGEGAQKRLKGMNIEIKIVPKEMSIEEIINKNL